MEKYNITGMSCAACSARVEKAVSAVKGVKTCSVNLLTNSMTVEGGDREEIIKAVERAGYGAFSENSAEKNSEEIKDVETPKMKLRLFTSLGFLIILMYISMGAMMFGAPLPAFLSEDRVSLAAAQMLLAGIIMVINQKFFINGFKGVIHRAPNMDTLVALGALAAFGYSVYSLFVMSNAQSKGDQAAVLRYAHELYFESAGMILTLITLGKLLEAYSKGKTTSALKGLMKLAPQTAVIFDNGNETTVPIERVKTGDIFVVKSGASIPVDGIVEEGEGSVDESALTGESVPADKIKGDEVFAATINRSGYMRCKATRVGKDTSLSRIIKMVSDASATKAPIAKAADKVAGVFVPAVLCAAAVTIAVWLICGAGVGYSLERGISVLVISCPCALGLATPVAIMVSSGVGAKNGILFKTAVSIEQTGKTAIAVFDKTGTITKGEPSVTDIIPAEGVESTELLKTAYSLEKRSEHPLAKAIIKYGNEADLSFEEPREFKVLRGAGISAKLNNAEYIAGNLRLCETYCDISDIMRKVAADLSNEGKTPLFFCREKSLMGIIAVADTIKEDSPAAISRLKNMGIKTIMLTGDNRRTAEAVGKLAGVDEVIAEVMPGDKEDVVKDLQTQGIVAMIGDGINDAPALTRADIGIAVGAGADDAIDAADVVLMKNTLADVPAAIRLSRCALTNIRQNLFWAFFYNVIGIPLAAGVWIPLFGWRLSPMFGAAAMSLSSFFVVTNALRLNLVKIYNEKGDKKLRRKPVKNGQAPKNTNTQKEEPPMEVTMKIEGMMCAHCEANVKKALEAVSGVSEAIVSHESGTAVVKLAAETDPAVLKKAVEDKDYKVIEIN